MATYIKPNAIKDASIEGIKIKDNSISSSKIDGTVASKSYVDTQVNDIPVKKGDGVNSIFQKGNNAYGNFSSAFGNGTNASGPYTHAEGLETRANGVASHAEGHKTITENRAEHAEGTFNLPIQGKTIHTVGIGAGTSENDRKNAEEIHLNGDKYVFGIGGYDGTNSQTEGVKTVQKVVEETNTKIDTKADKSYVDDNIIPKIDISITDYGLFYSPHIDDVLTSLSYEGKDDDIIYPNYYNLVNIIRKRKGNPVICPYIESEGYPDVTLYIKDENDDNIELDFYSYQYGKIICSNFYLQYSEIEGDDGSIVDTIWTLSSVKNGTLDIPLTNTKIATLETKNTELTNTITELEPRATNAVKVTYTELKSLRDAGNLVPGTQYRITDYTCTTTQANAKSAGHVFDIIVTADDESTLNEEARAALHSGDEYFSGCNLNAWKLWYCLDNDINRFEWVMPDEPLIGKIAPRPAGGSGTYTYSSPIFKIVFKGKAYNLEIGVRTMIYSSPSIYITKTDDYTLVVEDENNFVDDYSGISVYAYDGKGKGVIYRMIDEFGNDVPYDFKNIQFYRQWDSGKSLWSTISSNNTGVPCYTFSSEGNSSTTSFTDYSLTASHSIYSNVIKKYVSSRKQNLNNICFFGNYCIQNTFGNNCYENTFRDSCYSNTFGNGCSENTFGNECEYNTFGNYCYRNAFGRGCQHNIFGNECYANTFGNYCSRTTFGNSCGSNTFGNNCNYNTFGNNCGNNTFVGSCNNNTFGNGCKRNTFGNECEHNTFGNDCFRNTFGKYFVENTSGNKLQDNTFGNYIQESQFGDGVQYFSITTQQMTTSPTSSYAKSYIRWLIVENGVRYVNAYVTSSTSSSSYCQNVRICLGVQGEEVDNRKTFDITSCINSELNNVYQPANSKTTSV